MRRIHRLSLLASLAMLLLAAPVAHAELLGEFNARVKNVKLSYGAYTAVFDSRIYDTTGAPPPPLQSAQIRFPRGAGIRSQFLKPKYFCDTVRLEQTSDPTVCSGSRFGHGDILLDARPFIADAIPTSLFLFLAKPIQPGATASVAVLVVSNDRTPVYASQILFGNLFPDSGAYGFRLDLPTAVRPLVPNLNLSVAELNLTITGLRRTVNGKKQFWTKAPRCTAKRKVSFEANYQFANTAPIVKGRTLKCTQFLKHPAGSGKGKIPGAA